MEDYTNRNTFLLALYVDNTYELVKDRERFTERFIDRNYQSDELEDLLIDELIEKYKTEYLPIVETINVFQTDKKDNEPYNFYEIAEQEAQEAILQFNNQKS